MQDEETLKVFIDESLEHLADIEGDFLAMEQAGADIDPELVNKVYRAAHSIKGGAGFMGLTVIQSLTHEMENVLGKVRDREIVPTPEMVNILLSASDTLKSLLADTGNSNAVDISHSLQDLRAVTDAAPPAAASVTPSVSQIAETVGREGTEEGRLGDSGAEGEGAQAGVKPHLPLPEGAIAEAQGRGQSVYVVKVDLIQEPHLKGGSLSAFMDELSSAGTIIESRTDVDAVGPLLEDSLPCCLPLRLVYATLLQPEDITFLLKLEESRIFVVKNDMTVVPLKEHAPLEMEPAASAKSPGQGEHRTTDHGHIKPQQAKSTGTSQPDTRGSTVPKPHEGPDDSPGTPSGSEGSIRVQVGLLEMLMNLAGELVLGRNQLLQAISSKDSRLIAMGGQRMDRTTSELQEAIMLTRMQPVGIVLNKFPRVVRDLSRKLNKEVELRIEGKEVELDKTVIESINDPLTHLVRNAVDHGIESPEDRVRAGKPRTGQITLRAFHAAGQVNVEVRDDGSGLDGAKLAASAVSKGIITEQQAKTMSEKEKVNLIFRPGFSTAATVSDVSGRGVGMDVVRTNIERIGGHTLVESEPGAGTTIRIKLPLTLAIIPCQIVQVMGERFAIPQVNLVELLRIPPDKIKERIEIVGNAEVVRLRDELLPLVRLADVIGMERTYPDPGDGKPKPDRRVAIADRRSRKSDTGNSNLEDGMNTDQVWGGRDDDRRQSSDRRHHAGSSLNIAVVTIGTMKYGLIVDRLLDAEEIVVKPLGRHLNGYKGYAGATIMGDGRVSLILDVVGIAQIAQLNSVEGTQRAKELAFHAVRSKGDRQALLVFRNAENEQFAVPLGLVERIEKIKRTSMERIGGKRIIQYKGGSLPLCSLDEVAQVSPLADREDLIVVVFQVAGREIGLLATGPVDAVETGVAFDDRVLKQTGIMGSAIIGGHTTLLVDIHGLVSSLNPDWVSGQEALQTAGGEAVTILYAEDSRFFRNQVKGFMEETGYKVIEAEDGMTAWDLLQRHAGEVALVVTDIEMPHLDGYGLAHKIRSDKRFSPLPVIALTTLAGEDDEAKGRAAGIDDYQVKLDREKLMESIQRHLRGAG